MTAKETAIKNAYESAGVDWEQVKKSIGGNGWVIIHKYDENAFEWKPYFKDDEVETDYDDVCLWRPKSLSGIETNNGWIAIESENDLPPDGHYWTINKNGEINASPKLVDETCNDNQYWLSTFTHYQPILKPKPPIY